MIDAETQLDNTLALPNNTFQYNYTLINIDYSTLDSTEFKSIMTPNIVEQVKTNPQMEFFRKNKVTLNYYYRDKHRHYMSLITITPDMYEQE